MLAFVFILIALVRVDNGGFDALTIIPDTIVVIIAAVVIIIAVIGIVVGVVNLGIWLKLGHTPLIDVDYCYDVTVVIVVLDFVIVGAED